MARTPSDREVVTPAGKALLVVILLVVVFYAATAVNYITTERLCR